MRAYGVAEARARLSELLARAERGEEVVITRRGEPVGQLIRPAGAKTGGLHPSRSCAGH